MQSGGTPETSEGWTHPGKALHTSRGLPPRAQPACVLGLHFPRSGAMKCLWLKPGSGKKKDRSVFQILNPRPNFGEGSTRSWLSEGAGRPGQGHSGRRCREPAEQHVTKGAPGHQKQGPWAEHSAPVGTSPAGGMRSPPCRGERGPFCLGRTLDVKLLSRPLYHTHTGPAPRRLRAFRVPAHQQLSCTSVNPAPGASDRLLVSTTWGRSGLTVYTGAPCTEHQGLHAVPLLLPGLRLRGPVLMLLGTHSGTTRTSTRVSGSLHTHLHPSPVT